MDTAQQHWQNLCGKDARALLRDAMIRRLQVAGQVRMTSEKG